MPSTLLDLCEFREEIRKSRFITLAGPISSAAEAMSFIERHSDLAATHNCWAWKLGAQYRSSDDGEPGAPPGDRSWQPSKRRTATRWWCW